MVESVLNDRSRLAPNSSPLGPELRAFDHQPITRIVFGAGTIDRLGSLAAQLGGKRILVVSDRGILRAGHVDRALDSLRGAGLEPVLFDGVEENPTTRHVDACVVAAKEAGSDLLVGLGGGSSMDTAKGANFLISNGGRMADYWGVGKANKPMLPMIAVPTTAGTGSEAQCFALIADERTHLKMACGDKKAACRIAILDPELTVSQPRPVTAICGIDAVSHAIESYVTTSRTPISRMFAADAWRLLSAGFARVLSDPEDLDARGRMLLGAHFAGAAIENSMLGATHAAANPLTAQYGLTHGLAIGLMLPHVIRFNDPVVGPLYAELVPEADLGSAGAALARRVTEMVRLAEFPTTLAPVHVARKDIPTLAEQAAEQWTARFNPRPVTASDFEDLYNQAFGA